MSIFDKIKKLEEEMDEAERIFAETEINHHKKMDNLKKQINVLQNYSDDSQDKQVTVADIKMSGYCLEVKAKRTIEYVCPETGNKANIRFCYIVDYTKNHDGMVTCVINYCGIVIKDITFPIETFIIREERWKPAIGDHYFYINSIGNIDCVIHTSEDTGVLNKRMSIGNCFKSKQVAERCLDKLY